MITSVSINKNIHPSDELSAINDQYQRYDSDDGSVCFGGKT